MKKILFFIPNLSVGGAEKVLVNLVNNIDSSKFDITVQVLFDGGVNVQFLKKHIKYKYCFKKTFRGNSQLLKLFSPQFLYKRFIDEHYDIIVSYLEGPTARIVSGCDDESTKLISWIHCSMLDKKTVSIGFRNYDEALACYNKYTKSVFVSEGVRDYFVKLMNYRKPVQVLYNTNETQQIIDLSKEKCDYTFKEDEVNICLVGKISRDKGCDRILRIQKKLLEENFKTHIYFLGTGPEEDFVTQFAKENNCEDSISLLGYQTNPYKYVRNCDFFVCASLAEGFSTATTEALIVGTPVVTVNVSGMKEMLGANNEYGIITDNDENSLFEGIKKMISSKGMLEKYAVLAQERGKFFSTENTVKAVENMLMEL